MDRKSIPSKLTDIAIKRAKSRDKPYKISDGGGLFLLINPNGSAYWRLKYRYAGKEKTLALGVYPEVSLAKAREATRSARELILEGDDPSRHKKQEKLRKQNNFFGQIAKEWWIKQKGMWSDDHAQRVWGSIEKEAIPYIGDLPIHDISSQECLGILRKIEDRGALDIAGRIKQRMRAIFDYAIYTGRATSNPVSPLKDVIETRKVTHMPALPTDQLPAFLSALKHSDRLTETVRNALKLQILTFVRPGKELREAKWCEFNFEKQEWLIPEERMKMKREHIVPLSTQAIEVLQAMKPISGRFDYVFPGYHNVRKPMSENAMTFAIRKRLGFDATAHGFRTVASTILNESGFSPDVIERQLAHVGQNKIRAIYNKAEYLTDRKKMMQWWADHLDQVRDDK